MERNQVATKHFNDRKKSWTSNYDENDKNSHNFIARLKSVIDLLNNYYITNKKPEKTLDLGCGAGPYLPYLSSISKHVFAVDSGHDMIQEAKENLSKEINNVEFYVDNAQKIPLEKHSIDLIIGIGLIEYFDNQEEIIQEMKRVLKPQGKMIITFPNKFGISRITGLPRTLSVILPPNMKIFIAKVINIFSSKKNDPSSFYLGKSYTLNSINSLFKKTGLEIIDSRVTGYFPFRFFGFDFPYSFSVRLHRFFEEKDSITNKKRFGNSFVFLVKKDD